MDSYELAFDGRTAKAVLARREQREGPALWGIFDGSSTCLIAPATWVWESQPSNRTDAYLARSRRTIEGALDLWRDHLLATCAGATYRDAVVGATAARDCLRVHDPDGVVERIGEPVDRPRLGTWVGSRAVEAYGHPGEEVPAAEAAADLDGGLRAGIAILADRWRARGLAEVTIARDRAFEPEVAAALRMHQGSGSRVLGELASDLSSYLKDGRAFRIGDALLLASGEAVQARVQGASDAV